MSEYSPFACTRHDSFPFNAFGLNSDLPNNIRTHSWIPSVFPGEGNAFVYDEQFRPKLAYASLASALREASEGAPQITDLLFAEGSLTVRGEDFDEGAVLLVDGKQVKALVRPGELTVRDFQRTSGARNHVVLQIQAGSGKLSSPRTLSLGSAR